MNVFLFWFTDTCRPLSVVRCLARAADFSQGVVNEVRDQEVRSRIAKVALEESGERNVNSIYVVPVFPVAHTECHAVPVSILPSGLLVDRSY